MRTRAGAVLAAVIMAAVLAACGGTQDTTRARLAGYLGHVNTLERRLDSPVATIDQVDRQLAASVNRGHGSGTSASAPGDPTTAAEQGSLREAVLQIRGVSARLQTLATPLPAAHLRALLVDLADGQSDLAVQTSRLILFIPGFARALAPLPRAVRRLERALAVQQASGTTGVRLVYANKAAALGSFVATLNGILHSLDRLVPPSSSLPTYVNERRSLHRMSVAASALASDLASGRTTRVASILQSFDRAAAIPGSLAAQRAERTAVRAYNRQVAQLNSLVAAANRERLALARRYP